MLSTSIQAERYDIRMLRAAALIDPVSRIAASSWILPGPKGLPPCRYSRSSILVISLITPMYEWSEWFALV